MARHRSSGLVDGQGSSGQKFPTTTGSTLRVGTDPQGLSSIWSEATFAAYRATVLADSPSAYYRLGESAGTTAVDELATNNGTYTNSPTLGVTGALVGDSNTAAAFVHTSDQYVSVPNATAFQFGNGPLTFECWFKRASVGNSENHVLMMKGIAGNASPQLSIPGDGTNHVEWRSDGWGNGCLSSITIADTTRWHHAVATKTSGNVWNLYLDGADVTSAQSASQTANDTNPLNIGRTPSGTLSSFDGSIDEVAVYKTALTLAQVQAHYAAGTNSSGGGGPNNYTQALTAALSFAGVIAKRVSRGLSGTLSFSGTFAKRMFEAMTGALSFSGAQTRRVGRSLVGALSFSGTTSKQLGRALGGVLSFAGSSSKATARAFAGVLSFAGAMGRGLPKVLTGALSFAGAQTRQFGRTFAGALSFAGAQSRRAGKTLTGALSFTGATSKQARRALAGVLSFTGVSQWRTGKSLAGVLSFGQLSVTAATPDLVSDGWRFKYTATSPGTDRYGPALIGSASGIGGNQSPIGVFDKRGLYTVDGAECGWYQNTSGSTQTIRARNGFGFGGYTMGLWAIVSATAPASMTATPAANATAAGATQLAIGSGAANSGGSTISVPNNSYVYIAQIDVDITWAGSSSQIIALETTAGTFLKMVAFWPSPSSGHLVDSWQSDFFITGGTKYPPAGLYGEGTLGITNCWGAYQHFRVPNNYYVYVIAASYDITWAGASDESHQMVDGGGTVRGGYIAGWPTQTSGHFSGEWDSASFITGGTSVRPDTKWSNDGDTLNGSTATVLNPCPSPIGSPGNGHGWYQNTTGSDLDLRIRTNFINANYAETTWVLASASDPTTVVPPSGSSTLVRRIARILTAGLSFTGAIAKATPKAFTAALSFSGAIAKRTARALTGGLSFSGAIAAIKNAGGTAYTQGLTAVLSFTGAQTKLIGKSLSGALSFAGAIAKRTSRTFTAALSFTGALARASARAFTAALSFAGAVAKRTNRGLSAVLSFTGADQLRTSRAFTAALSFSGAIAKRTARILTGVLDFSGILAAVKSSGPILYTQTLTAALSFSGAITKRTSRALAGVLSFTGAATKTAVKSFSGALSFSGTMTRRAGKALVAALSFSGAIAKQGSKALAGGLSFTGAIAKRTARQFIAGLSFSGIIAALKNGGATAYTQTLTGVLSFSGAVTKRTSRALTAVLDFSGALAKGSRRALAGVLSFAGAITTGRVTNKALTAVLSFSGATRSRANKVFAATLSFSGTINRRVARVLASVLSFAGSVASSGGALTVTGGLGPTLTALGARLSAYATRAGPPDASSANESSPTGEASNPKPGR